MNCKYLIIGGGLSALYAASAIRERDKTGRLVIVSEERHLPYDRVPLSKGYLMDKVKKESLFPRKFEFFEKEKIELVNGRKCISIDAKANIVELDDGSEIQFEKLLLATGGRPRKLSIPGSGLKKIHYLRTIDDCESIKREMVNSRNVVIIGGGFIGCELASSFKQRGLDVTIIEAAPSILSLAFDGDTARWVEGYLREKGVKIMTNSLVKEFIGEDDHVTGVMTNDGRVFNADFVVVAIGIIPDTELAEQAGIKVDKGIVVNEYLETNLPWIFSAGDVARFYHPIFGHHMRVEHYDVAVKHGRLAGSNMAGGRNAFTAMPYFFSYMFDLIIEAYGDMSKRELAIRRGNFDRTGFFQFFFTNGRLTAFIAVNRPRQEVGTAKRILANGPSYESIRTISHESVPLDSFIKKE